VTGGLRDNDPTQFGDGIATQLQELWDQAKGRITKVRLAQCLEDVHGFLKLCRAELAENTVQCLILPPRYFLFQPIQDCPPLLLPPSPCNVRA